MLSQSIFLRYLKFYELSKTHFYKYLVAGRCSLYNSLSSEFPIRQFHITMKAIKVDKFSSDSTVLQLQNVEIPAVSGSKVLVKIAAAGVNPADIYIREGKYAQLPDLPYIPGKDGAGSVHLIGPDVTKFKVGQRVFICGMKLGQYGTYAEYCLANEDQVFPLDDKLTFEEGAALGIAYFTAYRALVLKGKCKSGETILIHGASGAVGLACVQMAKNLGLVVFGTAGTKEGMDLVKKNGADFVFCHKDEDYLEKVMEKTGNVGVNVIIEMLSNVNFDKDLDILAVDGRLLIVGCRGTINIFPRKIMTREIHVVGVILFRSTEADWEETSKELLKGIQDGWVKPVIDRKYPLEKTAEAQDYIMNSTGAKGKIILSVQ